MTTAYYPKRNGEYVYDVTVSKDETVRLSRRYRAHLSTLNVSRVDDLHQSRSTFPTLTVPL
jgi:hypothetical protein